MDELTISVVPRSSSGDGWDKDLAMADGRTHRPFLGSVVVVSRTCRRGTPFSSRRAVPLGTLRQDSEFLDVPRIADSMAGSDTMTFSSKFARCGATVGVVACAIAGLGGGVAAPTANAAPCTASGLAATAGPVFSEVGSYLDAHQGANDVLTAAATQSPDEARSALTGYFTGHVGEFLALRSMTRPLSDLRAQCGVAISPNQFLTLYETLSSANIG